MNQCPPLEQLERFLNEQLKDPEQIAIANHVEKCSRCRDALEQLAENLEPARWYRSFGPKQKAAEAHAQLGAEPDKALLHDSMEDFLDRLIQTPPPLTEAPPSGSRVRWPEIEGYEILGEIGRGGMSVVYKARPIRLNRIVAITMILQGRHAGPAERARFRAEAETVASFQHPNIVQIYEVGEHDGCPFLALEFLDGGSMKEKVSA